MWPDADAIGAGPAGMSMHAIRESLGVTKAVSRIIKSREEKNWKKEKKKKRDLVYKVPMAAMVMISSGHVRGSEAKCSSIIGPFPVPSVRGQEAPSYDGLVKPAHSNISRNHHSFAIIVQPGMRLAKIESIRPSLNCVPAEFLAAPTSRGHLLVPRLPPAPPSHLLPSISFLHTSTYAAGSHEIQISGFPPAPVEWGSFSLSVLGPAPMQTGRAVQEFPHAVGKPMARVTRDLKQEFCSLEM